MIDISCFNKNPWLGLPKNAPFILSDDSQVLKDRGVNPDNLNWKLELLPVPYLGNPNKAKVVVLCLNPGYNKILDERAYFKDKYYFRESLESLKFTSHTPFYCLDTKFDYSGGYLWWTRLLKPLIKDFGLKVMSEKLMCLQYIGYHSITFREPPCILPSQKFTFYLLEQAIKENKTIVIMRSKKLWIRSVPKLGSYPFIELKNYRMPFLTEKNTERGDFQQVINALQG
ncbi:MAG: hypothetical protein KJ915_05690 [Candidatus Omnitrophica bacterium]|nr:hypothetical protein [Candidatus Omnitrophota bacterium]